MFAGLRATRPALSNEPNTEEVIMSIRKVMTLAGLALAVAAFSPAAALAKAGGTDRPISASGPGRTTANLATETFVFEFSGTGSHLGKFTATTGEPLSPQGRARSRSVATRFSWPQTATS